MSGKLGKGLDQAVGEARGLGSLRPQQEQPAKSTPEAMTTETIRIPQSVKDRAEAKAKELKVKRTRLLRWIIEDGLKKMEAGELEPPTRTMADI